MQIKVIIISGIDAFSKNNFKDFIKKYDKEKTNIDRFGETGINNRVKFIATTCGWRESTSKKDKEFLENLRILLQNYNDLPYKTTYNFIKRTEQTIANNTELNPYIFVEVEDTVDIERLVKDFDCITVLIQNDNSNYNYNYDYVIDNNGVLKDLQAAAKLFWDEVLQAEKITEHISWENVNVDGIELKFLED